MLTPAMFRRQFPELAASSDAELAEPIAEAATIYTGDELRISGYLAAHIHAVRALEAKGEMPDPPMTGYDATSYGRHYTWLLRRGISQSVVS